MLDDGLFPDDTSGNLDGSPSPAPMASPAPVTLEAIQALIQPLQTGLQSTQSELAAARAENQSLQSQLSGLYSRPTEQSGPAPDFLDEFTNDAQGTVQREAKNIVDQRFHQLAPLLETQITATHSTLVDTHRATIEREFGAGAWDEHFAPVLNLRTAETRKSNPTALIDPNWIRNEVLGIKGLKMDALIDLRSNQAKLSADAKQKEREEMMANFNATGMTGGQTIAPPNSNRPATDDERAYAASRAAAGLETNIESIRKSKAIGNKLSDYKKSHAQNGAAR